MNDRSPLRIVILSEAKDLLFAANLQIPRSARDDKVWQIKIQH